jgi:hypothetical protein
MSNMLLPTLRMPNNGQLVSDQLSIWSIKYNNLLRVAKFKNLVAKCCKKPRKM